MRFQPEERNVKSKSCKRNRDINMKMPSATPSRPTMVSTFSPLCTLFLLGTSVVSVSASPYLLPKNSATNWKKWNVSPRALHRTAGDAGSLSSPLSSHSALNLSTSSAAAATSLVGGSISTTAISSDQDENEENILREPSISESSTGNVLVAEGREVPVDATYAVSEQPATDVADAQPETSLRGGNATSILMEGATSSTNIGVSVSLPTTKQSTVVETKKERRTRIKMEKSHKKYAKKLKNRNHLNLSRKVVHAGFGLFFATLNQIIPKAKFVPGMTVLTTFTLVMELLRYRKNFGWINDTLHFVLGSSLRKHEMEGKFTGSFYYFAGVTITSALFPTTCASLGICQLALADPSASFFGRQTRHVYWSRIENGFFGIGRNKGVLGFLGGALFCFPFNYRVLSVAKYGTETFIPGGRINVAIASLALGMAGAFADLCVPTPALTMPKTICKVPMPPLHVDDNVVVPIVSGYACTKIFAELGWTQGVNLAKFILF